MHLVHHLRSLVAGVRPLRRTSMSMISSMEVARSMVGLGFMASTLTLSALYVGQRTLIFPRPSAVAPVQSFGGAKVQVVRISATGAPRDVGAEVICAYFAPPDDTSPVLVYWHGNADQIGWSGCWLGRRLDNAVGFLAVEYPGYGMADGRPTQESIFWSARRVIDYAIDELGISAGRLCLVGQSIGCAAALHVAAERPQLKKLVLLSPFTSLPDVAATLLPIPRILLDALIKDPFRNDLRAPHVLAETLVVHGTEDNVIPFAQGRRIAKQLADATFLDIQGAGHNDLFSTPHDVSLLSNIISFCTRRRRRVPSA